MSLVPSRKGKNAMQKLKLISSEIKSRAKMSLHQYFLFDFAEDLIMKCRKRLLNSMQLIVLIKDV